jgi:hypothetical protein
MVNTPGPCGLSSKWLDGMKAFCSILHEKKKYCSEMKMLIILINLNSHATTVVSDLARIRELYMYCCNPLTYHFWLPMVRKTLQTEET